jgi:hypothetical protein
MAAVIFLGSLAVLLAPGTEGRKAMLPTALPIAALLNLWFLASYILTAVQPIVQPPPLVESLGLRAYATPPPAFLPLTAQLVSVLVLSGLARSWRRLRCGCPVPPPPFAPSPVTPTHTPLPPPTHTHTHTRARALTRGLVCRHARTHVPEGGADNACNEWA